MLPYSRADVLSQRLWIFVLLTQYMVDKFLFTKFYAAPPTMTNALALLLSELIPVMIAGRSIVAAWMWTAPSLIGGDADDDELLLSAWAVARKRIDHANALPHVVLVIVVLLVELRRLLKCRCTSVDDEDDNDTTYFRAIRTATLERRLTEKTLKPRILNEYRNELRRRKHQPVIEEPQFQTLESYDLRACPVYAGEFALDSRAVRRVDHRRSVGGERVSVTSFRTSFGRGRDSLESALDEEEACASSSEDEDEIYVEETEPDDDRRRSPLRGSVAAGRARRWGRTTNWRARPLGARRPAPVEWRGRSARPGTSGCRTSRCARRRGRRLLNPSPPSRMRNRSSRPRSRSWSLGRSGRRVRHAPGGGRPGGRRRGGARARASENDDDVGRGVLIEKKKKKGKKLGRWGERRSGVFVEKGWFQKKPGVNEMGRRRPPPVLVSGGAAARARG